MALTDAGFPGLRERADEFADLGGGPLALGELDQVVDTAGRAARASAAAGR